VPELIHTVLHPDGVAHLELNRPEARNALNRALADAVRGQLDAWAADDSVRAVVLSGAGTAFAAGADIAELKARDHSAAFHSFNQRLFSQIEDFPRPVVAAIDGFALGGGLELALACDLRIASHSAKLGLPEVTLGVFPSAGATWRLPRLIGLGQAKALIYSGRIVSGSEAHDLGLVEQLVPSDAVTAALAWARTVAHNDPLAVQVAKAALNALSKNAAAPALEWFGQGLLYDSPQKHRRMQAFLDKKSTK
jgi:enoyl-CoA hydratase/carnithine racemase